jgi:hypothetical protein
MLLFNLITATEKAGKKQSSRNNNISCKDRKQNPGKNQELTLFKPTVNYKTENDPRVTINIFLLSIFHL